MSRSDKAGRLAPRAIDDANPLIPNYPREKYANVR